MLTDQERNDIIDEYMHDNDCSIHDMCKAIERAVLAKAGEQEPFAYALEKSGCRAPDDCEDYLEFYEADKVDHRELAEYEKHGRAITLYAHPLPAQAIPEGWRLTDYGQIKAGDVISLVMAGRRICTSAKEVLNAGTKQEEIVYNRKKNHYFITSMVLDGTSNHKDVFIIPADSLSASPKP